jgi:hypothetical protein
MQQTKKLIAEHASAVFIAVDRWVIYRGSPGCDGLVEFGGGVVGAGKVIPAGCSGITSSGAFGYL